MVDKIVYFGRDVEDAIATGVIKQSDIPKSIIKALGKNNGAVIGTFVEDLIENSFGGNYVSFSKSRARLLKKLKKFNYEYIYNSNIAKQYNDHAKRTLTSLFDILLIIIESTNRFSDGNTKRLNISPNSEVYKIFKLFVQKDMKAVYTVDTPNGLIVLDFIAGMTDNFAVRSFQELFVPQPMV
jgi:dGTPase